MQGNGRSIRLIWTVLTISSAMVNAFSCIPLARGQQEGPLAMAQAQRGAAVAGLTLSCG
jgi:hypothetical protein